MQPSFWSYKWCCKCITSISGMLCSCLDRCKLCLQRLSFGFILMFHTKLLSCLYLRLKCHPCCFDSHKSGNVYKSCIYRKCCYCNIPAVIFQSYVDAANGNSPSEFCDSHSTSSWVYFSSVDVLSQYELHKGDSEFHKMMLINLLLLHLSRISCSSVFISNLQSFLLIILSPLFHPFLLNLYVV